ncbi:cytochrome P450 4C1-like [Planococcus citri]|uniref:cytochrome P450 4C1-like n=1 Tax=Planococcus citri TaxID=170843 RepID=UPI0031F976EC
MNAVQILACIMIIVILIKHLRKSKNKRFYELLEQFSSHPRYPLIGNAHMLFGPVDGLLSRFEKIMNLDDRVLYWFGPLPLLYLKKHDDIAVVLNQSSDRDFLGVTDEWLGMGILNARYEEWKTSRKMLSPAFSSNMLLKYAEVFEKHSLEFVENLKPVAISGEEIDVWNWLTKASIDAISETSFGVSIQTGGKMGEAFCIAMHDAVNFMVKRFQYPWLILPRVNMIYLRMIGKINSIHNVQQYPNTVLKKKIEDFQNLQRDSNISDHIDTSKAIIDSLVRCSFKSVNVTETRMRDELLHIMGAAIETSPLNTSFVMLMLAIHQDIQQKAYDEVSKLETDYGTFAPNDVINSMPYLDQCIKETLRMFSPVIITTRRIHKDIMLKDNKIIPANAFVGTFIHFANYDPELYKNPEKFDPDHFSKEAVEARPKTSQLSFGYGSRSCIGGKYAMLFNKMLVAYILRDYHLSTSVKEFTREHIKMDLSIKSKIGYPIKFTSR